MQTGSERQSLSQWFQIRGGDPGQHGCVPYRQSPRETAQSFPSAPGGPAELTRVAASLPGLPAAHNQTEREEARGQNSSDKGTPTSFLGARTQGGWDDPTGNHHPRPRVAAEGLYEKLKVAQARATPQVSLALPRPGVVSSASTLGPVQRPPRVTVPTSFPPSRLKTSPIQRPLQVIHQGS